MKILPLLGAAAIVFLLVRRRKKLELPLIVGGVLVAGALAAYGSGMFVLPNLEQLLTSIGTTLGDWTYLLVGALAFLESGAFVGLIAPGETAMVVGGVVAGQGVISVVTLIGIVWIAATLGDLVSYELGRRLGREFIVKHGPRFGMTAERLAMVEKFFEKHGGKTIFLGRFVGIVRAVAPFLAGSSRMPMRQFLPYDILGAGLWSTAFIMLGYVFWQSFGAVLKIAKEGALGVGIVISVIVGAVWIVRHLSNEENRHALEHRMLAAVDRPGLRFLQPIVRWAQGPLRFFVARITPGTTGLDLTTLLTFVAVGTFAYFGYWIVIADRGYGAIDKQVQGWSVDLYNPAAATVAKVLTTLGAPLLMYTLVAAVTIVLLVRRQLLEAFVLGVGMLLTIGAVELGKNVLDRPRPPGALIHVSGSSYPSGHTAYAVAWVVLVAVAVRLVPALKGKWWIVGVAFVIPVLVGATRIYLQVHWLSDTLGGGGVAMACFALMAIIALLVKVVRDTSEPKPNE
ncbi:MAG: bifunctional DedA family/phosphatase PAP2 family protein [Actinomycetes bacterium]